MPNRGGYCLNTDFNEVKTDMGRMFGFAYGHKENGAVFCHMAVMYAYALYERGFVAEGWHVLELLYRQAADFGRSRILPGIPEYFDDRGIPMWCFYNNRGQGVCSFGARDKDHAILEFRQFIAVRRKDGGIAHSCMAERSGILDRKISAHRLPGMQALKLTGQLCGHHGNVRAG